MMFAFSLVAVAHPASPMGSTPAALAAAAVERKLRRLGEDNVEGTAVPLERASNLDICKIDLAR
jgi:hypothetical protein